MRTYIGEEIEFVVDLGGHHSDVQTGTVVDYIESPAKALVEFKDGSRLWAKWSHSGWAGDNEFHRVHWYLLGRNKNS